jgi:tRNA G10  N-methylase Trm11
VLPDEGDKAWTRGMGTAACELACAYLRAHTQARCVVDPFCGRGSALVAASRLGFDVIGVELSAKRCRTARAALLQARAR